MRSFVYFCWTGSLLNIFANPLPSDMFYDDFYGPDSEVQEDSLFGDMALADPSWEGLQWEEPEPEASFDTGSLWTFDNGVYDMLPPDSSQYQLASTGSDPLMSSCDGAGLRKRDQLSTRDGGVCSSPDAPLEFKIPTISPLQLPKKPTQNEFIPTLGRLRWGPSPGAQDPICSLEPYDHHLCCDGPLGDEAMDFGDLHVYTPIKNCNFGKAEPRQMR